MAKEAGTVCESVIHGGKIFEWKISDFLQLEGVLCSPVFCFSDASWRIYIYPRGREPDRTVGYICLFLYPELLPKPLTVKMTLCFKNVNGKRDLEETSTYSIDKIGMSAFYRPNVIPRSGLIRRESELLPSGTLTVICTLKNMEPNVVNERQFLDASVQTGEITEHKLLDASAQTEEITEHKFLDATAQTEERTEFLDASVQTGEITAERQFLDATVQTTEIRVAERQFLDVSVQTGEITGLGKLQKKLNEISLDGNISDVILRVKDQEFKSHRSLLAARSPVFSSLMENEMKENVTGVVDIQDMDPKTFSDFLNYLNTGSTEDLRPENVAKLYTVADKYQVECLKENCLNHMLTNVSVENFCDIFAISVKHNKEKLKETCIEYFAQHSLDIIQTCKWQSLLCENPIICSELYIKHLQLKYLIPQTETTCILAA